MRRNIPNLEYLLWERTDPQSGHPVDYELSERIEWPIETRVIEHIWSEIRWRMEEEWNR